MNVEPKTTIRLGSSNLSYIRAIQLTSCGKLVLDCLHECPTNPQATRDQGFRCPKARGTRYANCDVTMEERESTSGLEGTSLLWSSIQHCNSRHGWSRISSNSCLEKKPRTLRQQNLLLLLQLLDHADIHLQDLCSHPRWCQGQPLRQGNVRYPV